MLESSGLREIIFAGTDSLARARDRQPGPSARRDCQLVGTVSCRDRQFVGTVSANMAPSGPSVLMASYSYNYWYVIGQVHTSVSSNGTYSFTLRVRAVPAGEAASARRDAPIARVL